MSRYPEHPTAPRGAVPGNARVLSDISGSDRMEEARRRRERALAVTAPANTDAVASPAALLAISPMRPARRLLDGALVAGAFLLGATLFAPLAGYAALGKLPFNLGVTYETAPALTVETPALAPPIDNIATADGIEVAFGGAGGTRPPGPPGLGGTTQPDVLPLMAFGGTFFATTVTTAPVQARPALTDTAFAVETVSLVDRAQPAPGLAAEVPAQILPQVQGAILDVNVYVHAPGSARLAAGGAITALRSAGLDPVLTDPVTFGISQSNIRFFHAEDRAAATEVARILGAELRNFTDFRPSPRIGTVEVWIAGRSTTPQVREVPLVDFSTLPVPEALAPLPQESRRNNVLTRIFGSNTRQNRLTDRQEREDGDDNRFNRAIAAADQSAAEDPNDTETASGTGQASSGNDGAADASAPPDEQPNAEDGTQSDGAGSDTGNEGAGAGAENDASDNAGEDADSDDDESGDDDENDEGEDD